MYFFCVCLFLFLVSEHKAFGKKIKRNPLKTWSGLKRSESLKSCPILVWETRSNVARSASMAASTAIVCELGFGKEWSTQQR